ncbi:heterokaryon incompatibility protein-domain-containing protein [Aspergillus granulosus]|uniref:Heterokaryon incompatibility protein-domain-containing protein n=1 Tax=Aspergillus granulosus TaxID=176169 RepID=A0ABR4GTN1_9EURO
MDTRNPFPYRYSPLTPGTIRLLRLLPDQDTQAKIRCQLFTYPLQQSSKPGIHLYEALSYVWGDQSNLRSIFLDGHGFPVTANLHRALLHLRDQLLERIIWIDAICINQKDLVEQGQQVRYMAEIYSRASCVIVWLGEAGDSSDAVLESMCSGAGSDGISAFHGETMKESILALLHRPWFTRIWVLQEVGAARHVIILCGSTQVEGHAFCQALSSPAFQLALQESSARLQGLIQSVVPLIEGATFRFKNVGVSNLLAGEPFSLRIRPLGELIEMYHTRDATMPADKVFALLGMSSDNPIGGGLLPDYTISFGEVMKRAVRFLLGPQVSIKSWTDVQMAVIEGYCHIIGKVSSVNENTQEVVIISRDTFGYLGPETHITMPPLTNPVLVGDLVCLLQGSSVPMIIRPRHDYFTIVIITASTSIRPERPVSEFPHRLILAWDWDNSRSYESYDALIEGRVPKYRTYYCWSVVEYATVLWNTCLALEDAEEYDTLPKRLEEAVEHYVEALGTDDAITAKCKTKLVAVERKRRQWELAARYSRKPVNFDAYNISDHTHRSEWIVELKFKQQGTGFFINIPSANKDVILTAGHNIVDQDGVLSRNMVVSQPHLNYVLTENDGLEFVVSSAFTQSPSLNNAENDFGAILVPRQPGGRRRGFGFALQLAGRDLAGAVLEIATYGASPTQRQLITIPGRCTKSSNCYLRYSMATQRGFSGAPVFMAYGGQETIVAIQ